MVAKVITVRDPSPAIGNAAMAFDIEIEFDIAS